MKRFFPLFLLPLLLLAVGCSRGESEPETANFFAMDTAIELSVYGDASLLSDVQDQVAALEKQISVTKAESEIYAINANGSGTLTGKAAALMDGALALCRRTDGALDISVYPIVRAWGFTTGKYQVPEEAELQKLLPLVDYTQIRYDAATGEVTLPEGMEIDLGSVGKGYAAGQAAQYLRDAGVSSALLNFGGNVQTVGSKPDGTPWQIGIKDPETGEAMLVLSVQDKAVVTSGGYERYFEQDGRRYWHIMDPETGRPADSDLRSVSIIGEDGLVCDGLSTSLFVMGLEKAADFWGRSDDFEAVLITADGTVYITEGLQEQFALLDTYQDTSVKVIKR